MNRCVQKVLAECARWEVPVLFSEEGAVWQFDSSLHDGLWVENWQRIHIDPLFLTRHIERAACALLHELSHVLQGSYTEDEIGSGMLGFEYVTYRRLKLNGWLDWMQDYVSTSGEYWHKTNLRDRAWELKRSRLAAYEKGLLDANFQPTYRR